MPRILTAARSKIGELFDKHLQDNDVSEAVDFEVDGSVIYISFHKSQYPQSITASVTTDEYVYRFHYTGKPNERFYDCYLEYLSATPSEMDD